MIQVLQRATRVLELLADEEPLALKELTERTGLKKPTLCLILKSLVELGFARKVGNGLYATGTTLQRLALKTWRRDTVQGFAEEAVGQLAAELREGAVAAVIHQGKRYTLAQAAYRQALMVDTRLQARGNFYDNATGRILLAFMDEDGFKAVYRHNGPPTADIWPEATTCASLRKALAIIRKQRLAVMTTGGGAVRFVSVPAFGPDDRVWLALGVSVPDSRFRSAHKEAVLSGLHSAATELSHRLELAAGTMPQVSSDLSDPSDLSDLSDPSDPSDLSDLSDPSDLSDLSDKSDKSDKSDPSDRLYLKRNSAKKGDEP